MRVKMAAPDSRNHGPAHASASRRKMVDSLCRSPDMRTPSQHTNQTTGVRGAQAGSINPHPDADVPVCFILIVIRCKPVVSPAPMPGFLAIECADLDM